MTGEKMIDRTGRMILDALLENARISFSELGRKVGLSPPAAAERVRRLEESGYIKGYAVCLDQVKLGCPITAFISLRITRSDPADTPELLRSIPEITEAHHLTGADEYLLKVSASSISHLEEIASELARHGRTATQIVLSSPVVGRHLVPLDDQ